MDVSGGGVVNGLLFSQTADQMADITGIMVVNQNTEFIPADAVQFSVTGENFPENMCGIRNILIPTVMSEFIIVVFQVSISFRDTNAVSQARVTIKSSMAMRPTISMSCDP